ncbi:hypothetical protein BLNAU_2979 [Blattamonas nauphoetae]|uniref:Uncharacterized protein n=1 Tax=Blattamonas nauphoetae TaxID=2049346 RepID=A0ABQ9YDS4_9EUKA|nr:hypothetical protein BLNAU_2979 [Blattamonas nauphoetae]
MKQKVTQRQTVTPSELTGEQFRNHPINSPEWNPSNISSLLQVLQSDDEDIVVGALSQLLKVASVLGVFKKLGRMTLLTIGVNTCLHCVVELAHQDFWSILFSFVHSHFQTELRKLINILCLWFSLL